MKRKVKQPNSERKKFRFYWSGITHQSAYTVWLEYHSVHFQSSSTLLSVYRYCTDVHSGASIYIYIFLLLLLLFLCHHYDDQENGHILVKVERNTNDLEGLCKERRYIWYISHIKIFYSSYTQAINHEHFFLSIYIEGCRTSVKQVSLSPLYESTCKLLL